MEAISPKDKFRNKCHKILKKAKKSAYIKDKYINMYLLYLIKELNAKDIMLYIPLEIEVNISPLIYKLRRQKCNIWVPFMEGKSFRLVKYRYPLRIKKFGIKEPKKSYKFRKKQITNRYSDSSYHRYGYNQKKSRFW